MSYTIIYNEKDARRILAVHGKSRPLQDLRDVLFIFCMADDDRVAVFYYEASRAVSVDKYLALKMLAEEVIRREEQPMKAEKLPPRLNIDTWAMIVEFNPGVWTARKLDRAVTDADGPHQAGVTAVLDILSN